MILELAFRIVEGAPPIIAGVLSAFTVKSALMTASAPMISLSFLGSK